ncbi:HAD family phosphatase [Acetobacteraceae bacterium KSS8]|uniref:HAD family phosphatase n=1 Tax=Endosaccharibacter trunci TaxID=2812733 RepID=A0ABT1WD42_9PROT|nr:HAD family phosphatase [Acetobacteraceae bacterium KSS8]
MDATIVRAVLCDMDGLLLDSERLSMRALVMAGAELGATLTDAFCRSLIGSPMDRCAAAVRAQEGPDFPAERLVALHEVFLDQMVEGGALDTRPGVSALLDTLDTLGLPRAVVTSSSRKRATTHLAHVGILERFDLLITRDDVVRGKPDPDPYLRGAAAFGMPPSSCLALEDSHNGVHSAHAAGVPVIMVPDMLEPTEESRTRAVLVADSLHEVAALLRARL